MNKVLIIWAFCGLFVFATPSQAQFWPFKKRSQVEKATEDLNKRKRAAGEGNMFNALRANDPALSDVRDDHIWAASTAATSYSKAGNISLSSPSRYGLTQGVELQSLIGLNFWAPNLFLKREISRERLWISSLHGIYSSFPGLRRVKKGKDTFLADSVAVTPLVLSIRNQLLLSRPFYDKMDCNPHQPYLILSAGFALDYGIPFDEGDAYLEDDHLYTPRSASYLGKGWLATFSLRVDWEIMTSLFGRGEIRAFSGEFPSRFAVEQQASAEFFLNRSLSVSGGFLTAFGNFGNHRFSVWPFVNLSLYFGKKQGRKRGLFGERMF
ncbi:hypothetical protein [Marinilabilia rubra]|uniref:DUF3316 domain-containing protein n=1 Tax=Marinilabilia rubra TaxID=2162893 RepID=A0A2U2B8P6_9BACT|nr:hypothetical protein [Marinilabilia rubra]PWD99438.1 hypothetical protein DDZ16_10545 [Marinilabilia rubra]